MRFLHLRVPSDQRAAVTDALADAGVDYVCTPVTDGAPGDPPDPDDRPVLVQFPLPAGAVDAVLDRVREAGFDGEYVVATGAETAVTPGFEDLTAQFDAGGDDDSVVGEELRAKARDLHPGPRTYYAMTLLSALVATVGLVRDSPAVVVGSMVIAPQVGAALSASVGFALGDRELAVDGLESLTLGVVVAAVAAAGFGLLLRNVGFVPPQLDLATVAQISGRTSPGILSVVVGVAAGGAGAFGLATDLPVSLVGVAVAAALVPAAAAAGIGLAWAFPALAAGAVVLLAINVLSITLAGAAALWYLGYCPDDWATDSLAANLRAGRAPVPGTAVVLVVLLVGGVVAGGVVAQQATFDDAANDAVERTLEGPAYDRLEVLGVRVGFVVPGVVGERRTVSVVVRRPADAPYPDLPDRLRRAVLAETGTDASVSVEYVDVARAPDDPDVGADADARVTARSLTRGTARKPTASAVGGAHEEQRGSPRLQPWEERVSPDNQTTEMASVDSLPLDLPWMK
jgi:uncharacterized hydrophobic protein (TIGR00271 family)